MLALPAIAPVKPVCLNIVALLAGPRLSRRRRFAQPLLLQLAARQALAALWEYWVVVADFPYSQVAAHILTKSNYS